MEKAPSLDEVRAPDEDVCFVIASNANCDSEGTSLMTLTCSSPRAGPIHRSMRCGVTVQKYVAASSARAPTGTAQMHARSDATVCRV